MTHSPESPQGVAPELDLHGDAVARYEAARDLAKRLQDEWEALGSPLLSEGGATGKAIVPHPMIKMIREAEQQAHRFSEAIRGKKIPGPDPVAVMKPVGLSPAQQLRSPG